MDKSDDNRNVCSSSALGDDGAGECKQSCTKCGMRKALSEFYFRDGKPDRVCKGCKKSAQKDNYKRKTFTENADSVIGNILNKVLDYKILRAKIVNEELGRLLSECETQLQGSKWATAS